MLILSIPEVSHDSNICFYDTESKKLGYISAEKIYDVKKATFSDNFVLNYLSKKLGVTFSKVVIITTRNRLFKRKLKLKINELYKEVEKDVEKDVFIIDHHYAHVLSAKAVEDSIDAGIAIDAGGNYGNITAFKELSDIKNTKMIRYQGDALGGSYFKTIEYALKRDIGKIMGLQSYGKKDIEFYKKIDEVLNNEKDREKKLKALDLFFKKTFDEMVKLNFPKDYNYDKLYTAHQYGVNMIVKIFDKYFDNYDGKIGYAGGCGLSIPANEALLKKGYNIVVCPAANDSGLSIGGMKFADMYFDLKIDWGDLQQIYFHPENFVKFEIEDSKIKKAAKLLAEGKIIAWCQGPCEVGPRALGHRSFLMNPSIPNGKDYINNEIKHREWWRPFGGSIIDTSVLENYTPSDLDPFMLKTFRFKDEWKEKFRAITHTDGTTRLQIVKKDENDPFYRLIKEFYKLTGIPGLLNTSYNMGGKPIACDYRTIINTYNQINNLKYLFVGNSFYSKE